MQHTADLANKLKEMAHRILDLREISGLTQEEMAKFTGVSLAEYQECESGRSDLNFAFIYRCAQALDVDVTDIIEGSSPRLSSYALTRSGHGQRIEEAHNMIYYNLASNFRNRVAEPLMVHAISHPGSETEELEVTSHEGQECDIVISGTLRVQIGDHTEFLNAGDSIYYDSSTPHGMTAVGGDCYFYAIVLDPGEDMDLGIHPVSDQTVTPRGAAADSSVCRRIYHDFITPVEDEKGTLRALEFHNENYFNFAFDVVDELAARQPEKLAMLHVDRNHNERRFTFSDISRISAQAANYLLSLGVRRGDRVMLILRRNWQFWPILMGLNKLGAIAIPATDQLLEKDLTYRFEAAGVTAVICDSQSRVVEEAEQSFAYCPDVTVRITTNGSRPGWHSFDDEYSLFSETYVRKPDAPCGNDLMLMFFTSGTTGYPKIAAHNYKYPLGHFITAKYWHCVDPDGLHLTISDTGWAKAMWGKLYGQWLCEAAVFVYDFDRFDAADIMPMFAKYGITTFCAPPTMYRFMIKEDLGAYDLSSIQHASIAGEALNPEVFYQFKKATGLSLMEGFGQSESTVIIGNLRGMRPKVGSMGKPTPLYQVELLGSDGKPVPAGETGEIVVNVADGAPCGLFAGYYRDEVHTKEAWHDGWYHTGDTAWKDEDGYYWYVGRVDDLIKSSGYRIGPFEIESVIMELPYILECGVSAAPDPIRGQVVKASIVLTKGTEATDELKKEIQDYVKKRTAPYKYPRIVVFKDELPKTTSGKIIRNKL